MKKYLPIFFASLISVSWLIPNHYPPWLSAWSDGVAGFALIFLALSIVAPNSVTKIHIAWQLPIIALTCCIVVLAQLAFGKLFFSGDALMAVLYIGFWIVAVLIGKLLATSSENSQSLHALISGWLFVAILSVGIALAQWTGSISLGIYGADLPAGARPFANIAQPNNFCTVVFIGLCGLLWLHQNRKLNDPVLFLGGFFLLLGMAASQSRTGWLQVGLMIVIAGGMRDHVRLRISRLQIFALGLVYGLLAGFWPTICDQLMLSAGRSLSDQMEGGIRFPYWWSMLDAISREPLLGYGWLQVGLAQQRVALDHLALGAYFDHSHNLFLDLMLWNGLLVGGAIIATLVSWLIACSRACLNAPVLYFLLSIAGIAAHAMVELPIEYAYILVPLGLLMGAVDAGRLACGSIRVPRWVLLSLTIFLGAIFAQVAAEYAKVEEYYRGFRFESSSFGGKKLIQTPVIELHWLTQLEAYFVFVRTEAKPGMNATQLDRMREVSERYGFSSVLLRYALATGLNGQPEVARDTLIRLCKIHHKMRCQEAREGWLLLREQYPQLSRVVLPSAWD